MNNVLNRRDFLYRVITPSIVLPAIAAPPLVAQSDESKPKPNPQERRRPAQLDLKLVHQFVRVSHSNIEEVGQLIEQEPNLVFASWDWGNGDWETGLGAASHIGRRDIAKLLLSNGARKDIFAAAMLGERKVVQAMVNADGTMAEQKGPHGFRVLYHVAISGDIDMADTVLANVGDRKRHLSQALHAAVRDGHVDMSRWLLDKGATSINKPNGLGEKPLDAALRHGNEELADVLREFGAVSSE